MYSYGLENTLKDMLDIIENKNSKEYKSVFKNLVCYLKPINEKDLIITKWKRPIEALILNAYKRRKESKKWVL